MDWEKLKVFHAAAEAGSFTHAGEQLGLSQSAVSRQVSALEQELTVSLFHRHARGLILTEQGEVLYRTAHEVFMKLEAARAKLTDSREKPNGELKVTTTPGIGIHWLTPRLGEFLELYPEIRITLITTDEELDLAMREADVAIRLRQPTQPDLIQRKLFSVHFHAYASPEYLKRYGTPRSLEELDKHRIMLLGGTTVPIYLQNRNWLTEVGAQRQGAAHSRASPSTTCMGLLRACQRGLGIALLPDYLVEENVGLVQLFGEEEGPALDAYFVYPEELNRSRACRCSAISWSATRSAGVSDGAAVHDSVSMFYKRPLRKSFCRRLRRMADMLPTLLRGPHGWHAALRVVRGARAALFRCADGARLSHPPRLASPVPSAVPLWKVIVGSRADMTEPGPQGPGFFICDQRAIRAATRVHAQSRSFLRGPCRDRRRIRRSR